MAAVSGWHSGGMRPRTTSTEHDLRRLLNEWDPIGTAGRHGRTATVPTAGLRAAGSPLRPAG